LRKEHPLEIEEVNILDDPDLYERYKYEIPVLLFPDGFDLQGRIDRKELSKKLKNFLNRKGVKKLKI
jgi:hypothetical protein